MDWSESVGYIEKEIGKHLEVYVNPEEFSCEETEENYDAHLETGSTVKYEKLRSAIENLINGDADLRDEFHETRNRIDEIDNLIRGFARTLATNAKIGNINVKDDKYSEHYKKFARMFVNKNKTKLFIPSKSFWF